MLTPEVDRRIAMAANRKSKSGGIRGIFALVCVVIVLSGARTDITAGPRYKTIDLGTLGGSYSWASAINNLGQVVGTSMTAGGDYHAFLWADTNGNGESDPGEMQDLGTLGGSTSYAGAINNLGQVVGSSTIAGGRYHAFLWDSDSGMIDLGTLNGKRFSHATGINDSGQVVGYSTDSTTPEFDSVAFLWDSVDGMVELLPSSPSPAPYPVTSKATGINNSGQVVGTIRRYYSLGGGVITVSAAFVWDSNDGPMLLGTLGGEWDDSSNANAINNIGQVAGGSATDEPYGYRAFLWDENEGMINLGVLAEMWTSVGYGINDAGCVVGHCHNNIFPGPEEAFMWDSANGMIALSHQLPGYSDWQELRIAYGINNLGQVVGSGVTKSQQERAFVMTPLAEPSTTHLVPAEYPTIQAAINAAWNGDTVIVAAGTYSGSGNRDLNFGGKMITVRSTDPCDAAVVAATVIDCNGSYSEPHRGFGFASGEEANSVVSGLTLTGGYAEHGGAIECRNQSSPTIRNCVIVGNVAEAGGGGIGCWEESSPRIRGCTISGNRAMSGGGISFFHGTCTIESCMVSGNEAFGYGGGILSWECNETTVNSCTITGNLSPSLGGGIYAGGYNEDEEGTFTVSNCDVSNNLARDSGGGIYCSRASCSISNCTITGNTVEGESHSSGGGILCRADDSAVIAGCTIRDNSATGRMGIGGGLNVEGCYRPIIADCIISGNASEVAGGVYWCRGTVTNCLVTGNSAGTGGGLSECERVINCTIAGNSATRHGGGVASCWPITNCIIWNNSAPDGAQIYGSSNPTYSCIQDWSGGEGNINIEPGFALESDYHLTEGSVCIDGGTNTIVDGNLPVTDLDGSPRPLDGDGDGNAVADMGAYEFSFESPTIAVSADSFYFVQDWPRPDAQKLSIRNCGGQPLNWEVVEDCDWLEVTPANGVSIDEIDEVTISVDPNGLAPNLYSYTFTVEDVNASNSPVEILVEMPVGEVLWVPSDGLETIQDAIDAAEDYDVVVVSDGNYTGERNKDLDFGGKAITVKSENGPDNCVIDCENSGRGFYFQSGEKKDSVVDGLTIRNGYIGVRCDDRSSPTIKNCVIKGNQSWGILCRESSPRIAGCTVSENSRGISCGYGPAGSAMTVVVTDCVISNNLEAGILCGSSTIATIENCIVSGNSSWSWPGGAIRCGYETTITNCVIEDNTTCGVVCGRWTEIVGCTIRDNNSAYERGGGVSCEEGRLTIQECRITNNVGWREGGGVYCKEGSVTITNSTITGNFVKGGRDNYGGGIYCGDDAELAVTNCTLTGNFVDRGGGGICCRGTGACEVSNCVLWGNEASEGPEIYLWGSDAWVRYSDVEGGQDGVYIDPSSVLDWGAGNIDADPVFVEPGAGHLDDNGTPDDSRDDSYFWVEGDYHLLEGSPCIDAGEPNYLGGPNETDLDGNPRVADGDGDGNSVVDMGVYEFTVAGPVEPLEMLAELGEMVEELGLSKGIENSLLAKLQAAGGVLEDDNEQNDGAAVNILEAFINAASAQSGKKIPEGQAEALIAEAAAIIEALESGTE